MNTKRYAKRYSTLRYMLADLHHTQGDALD